MSETFTRAEVGQAILPGHVTVRDIARLVFEADEDVSRVTIHDCCPSAGHVTIEIDEGDPRLVLREIREALPYSLGVHVQGPWPKGEK